MLDFGVAKAPPRRSKPRGVGTQEGAFVGTPSYMSPEQAEGMPDVDWRSDLWSLGVIAFECLVGQRPFEAEGLGGVVLKICSRPLPVPSQLAPVPAGFDAWFARACARNPDERFTDAKELAAELRTVCEDPRLVRSRPPRSEPPPPAIAPAAKMELATQPFWEKEPKVPAPSAPSAPSAPLARSSRRYLLPVLFALGALFGVVVAFRHSVNPSARIETAVTTIVTPPVPVDPPPVAPAPTLPPPAVSAEPAKIGAISTGSAAERAPARRGAPARTPKRAQPAPSPPVSPASTPAEPTSPPPRPSAESREPRHLSRTSRFLPSLVTKAP